MRVMFMAGRCCAARRDTAIDSMHVESFAGRAALRPRCPAMTTTTPSPTPPYSLDGEPRWYGNSLFEFLVPDDGDRRRA